MRKLIGFLCVLACVGCGSPSGSTAPTPPPQTDGGTPTGAVAVIQLDGTDGSGPAPDLEKLDGSASYSKDPNAHLTEFRWTFGDGTDDATGAQVSHTFQSPGSYTVTLSVTDSDGSSGTATRTIQVLSPEDTHVVAVARLDGTSGHGTAPDTEKFDGTGSHSQDPNATLTSCEWDFGDGESASGCRASHTFQKPGDFTVTLTAHDSNGDEGTDTLEVTVQPAPSSRIVWQRSFPGDALVGSDWNRQIVASDGSILHWLDYDTGSVLASHDFSMSPNDPDETWFSGRLSIRPGSSQAWGYLRMGGPRAYQGICGFTSDGGKNCAASLTDIDAFTPVTPAPDGAMAWATFVFDDSVTVLAPDGTKHSMELLSTSHPDDTRMVAAAAEPDGGAVVGFYAGSAFEFEGHAMGPSYALLRLDKDGHLVWWRKVPFEIQDLGISSVGTVVLSVTSKDSFHWGDGSAQGTVLVVADASGTERFARQLTPSVADSSQLSVLPKGRVAVVLNRASCGGPEVFRYDLDGMEQWHWDMADAGCDAKLLGVSILPDDVLVSGHASEGVDFGKGPLDEGGFVLRLAD